MVHWESLPQTEQGEPHMFTKGVRRAKLAVLGDGSLGPKSKNKKNGR